MYKLIYVAILTAALGWSQPAPKPVDVAFDFLQKGLQDTNPERRRMTAAALSGAGTNPKALELLYSAMTGDKDPEVRQAAAASLGEMKARVAIPKLKAAMENDPAVSFSAARALWLMGDWSGRDIIEEVATSTQKNPTGMVGEAKLEANRRLHDKQGLEKLGAEQAASALLGPFSIGLTLVNELRKDSGAQGRLLAVSMLAQQCDAESISSIKTAFENDKNEIVRAGSAKALGICGGMQALQGLVDAISSEKYTVQGAAAASVIRLSANGAQARNSLKKQ
jgi:HEAT repeat protein